jgi:hypothetical protein
LIARELAALDQIGGLTELGQLAAARIGGAGRLPGLSPPEPLQATPQSSAPTMVADNRT